MADGDDPRLGADAGALGEAYERLREAVLSSGAGGWRLGHGVLCARGMTAWMSAVGELAPPASRATGVVGVASRFASAGCEASSAETTVSLPGVDQVVAVLTQMVLPLAACTCHYQFNRPLTDSVSLPITYQQKETITYQQKETITYQQKETR